MNEVEEFLEFILLLLLLILFLIIAIVPHKISLFCGRICSCHPETALLAANTILQDCRDPNPVVKCLALSTFCSLPSILQERAGPVLNAALKDGNPRVRRTAVIGCGRVFKHMPDLLFEQGFIDRYMQLT
jgi:vesicle coat complex subunit